MLQCRAVTVQHLQQMTIKSSLGLDSQHMNSQTNDEILLESNHYVLLLLLQLFLYYTNSLTQTQQGIDTVSTNDYKIQP